MVPSEASSRVCLRWRCNFREPPCIGEMKSKEKNKKRVRSGVPKNKRNGVFSLLLQSEHHSLDLTSLSYYSNTNSLLLSN